MKIKTLFAKRPGINLDQNLALHAYFTVIKRLGSGSFATVYEVLRKEDAKLYAMKHLDLRAVDAQERTELVSEIRLLASLDHPNLMSYLEAFCDHQQLFIVTELASEDLAAVLEKRAQYQDWLPERQVWSYFLQLAMGVHYLHHNHVLHRDLKPQNVLITEGGLLKIADLGISQMLDHVFAHVLMGTPHYIAPEMWRRQPYSYSADIWALGCILHEMCSLKPLFLANTDREIRAKVLSGLLDAIPGRYSIELWDLIRLMLAPDPADRPTIDEILQMPSVQSRLSLLPKEVHPYLDPARNRNATFAKLIRISVTPEKWHQLNEALPAHKYGSGLGVAEALWGMQAGVQASVPRTNSCPELAELAEGLQGPSSGSDGGSGSGCTAGSSSGSSGQPGLASPSLSCPNPAGWSAATRLQRRSVMVGQLLHHRQQEGEAAAGGGAVGPPPADPLAALRRSRSSGDLPRPGAMPQPGAGLSRKSARPVACFDPSPLQFGGSTAGNAAAGTAPAVGGRVHGAGALQALHDSVDEHRAVVAAHSAHHHPPAIPAHHGAATMPAAALAAPEQGPLAAPGLRLGGHLPTLSEGDPTSHGGSTLASLSDLSKHGSVATLPGVAGDWSGHGASALGSPTGPLSVGDWSGHGAQQAQQALVARAHSAPALDAKKAGKKKVSFGSKMKKLLFRDEVRGAMHQPLW